MPLKDNQEEDRKKEIGAPFFNNELSILKMCVIHNFCAYSKAFLYTYTIVYVCT